MLRTWADSSLGIRVWDEKVNFLSVEYIWSMKSYQLTSEENHNKKTWENSHQNPQIKRLHRGAPPFRICKRIPSDCKPNSLAPQCWDARCQVWHVWIWDKLGRLRQKHIKTHLFSPPVFETSHQEATSCRLEKFPEGRWHQGYGWMGTYLDFRCTRFHSGCVGFSGWIDTISKTSFSFSCQTAISNLPLRGQQQDVSARDRTISAVLFFHWSNDQSMMWRPMKKQDENWQPERVSKL